MEVVYSSNLRNCRDVGLSLEAAGIPYRLIDVPGGHAVVVDKGHVSRALAEIEALAAEDRSRPGAAGDFARPVTKGHDPYYSETSGWTGLIGYGAVLGLITLLHYQNAFSSDWFQAGKMQAGLVRQGEFWRTVTALCLHGDLVHLAGNLVFGGLVGFFAGQALGSGLAWMSIVVAGALGNLVNAFLRQDSHVSIGASTAVFAALGLLAGHGWMTTRKKQASRFVRFAPIIGAIALLGYLGAGGETTDVLAHVTGIFAGMLLGLGLGSLGSRIRFKRITQTILGLGAVAIVVIAWTVALAQQG